MDEPKRVTAQVTLQITLADLEGGGSVVSFGGIRETAMGQEELKAWEVQGLILRALSMHIISEGQRTDPKRAGLVLATAGMPGRLH